MARFLNIAVDPVWQNFVNTQILFYNRRQSNRNHNQDYLGHEGPSVDHNFMIDCQIANPLVKTSIYIIAWRMHKLSSRGIGWREPLLRYGYVWWVVFFIGFPDFEILWFGSRFPFVDQGDRSQHRLDVLERLGTSSGARLWPDFLTFIDHMVIGFWSVFFRIFGFLWFESRLRRGDQEIIHTTYLIPLQALVTMLEPTRDPIS